MSLCQFCKSKFYDKSALNKHQKKTKYCLRIQDKDLNKESKIKKFECEKCKKELSTKQRLQSHLTSCKSKNSKEMQKMSSKLENLKNCSTTNITINVNNLITNNNYGSILHLWTFKTPIFQHKKLNDLY
jgi:hypothetical protein